MSESFQDRAPFGQEPFSNDPFSTDPLRPAGNEPAPFHEGSFTEQEQPDLTPQSPPREPRWGWTDLLFFFACSFVGMAACILLLMTAVPMVTDRLTLPVLGLIGQNLGLAIAIFAFAKWIKMRYKVRFGQAISWNGGAPGIHWAFAWGLTLGLVVILIGVALRTPPINSPMDAIMRNPANVPWIVLFAVTIGPLVEELVFRGLVLPLLARSIGAIAAIVLVAIPFALLHGSQYAWSWRHLTLILIAGIAFGAVRIRTRSVAYATLVHSGYNALFLISFLAQQWINAEP